MAFDSEIHEFHPETGFMVHKETGHVIGLQGMPPAASGGDPDWPKWVKPHHHHIYRQTLAGGGEHISTSRFTQHHVRRDDGEVTVLVHTPEEEAFALADPHAEVPIGA